MRIDWETVSIFLRTGYTDMRKQINGLSVLVQRDLKQNPLTGDLFVFCGRTRRILKVLYWERNGFCLWCKKLSADKYPWPRTAGEVKQIGAEEMRMLLAGIDFFSAHRERRYDFVT
jgi:transposase